MASATSAEAIDPTLEVNPQKSADCPTVANINGKYKLLKYDLAYYKNHRAQNTVDKNKTLLANILTKLHNITFELAKHLETEDRNEHLSTVRTLISGVHDGTVAPEDAVKVQIPTLFNETSAVYKSLLAKTSCSEAALAVCPYNKLGQKIPANMQDEKTRFHYEIQARLGNIDLKACINERPDVAAPSIEKLVEPTPENQEIPATPSLESEQTVIVQQ